MADGFHPTECLSCGNMDRPLTSLASSSSCSSFDGIRLTVVSGPFAIIDSHNKPDFTLLDVLFSRLNSQYEMYKCHQVALMMGPFVDGEVLTCFHTDKDENNSDSTGISLFNREFSKRLALEANKIPFMKVLLMPSLNDVFHECIFPQKPFSNSEGPALPPVHKRDTDTSTACIHLFTYLYLYKCLYVNVFSYVCSAI